ncbi:MAG TPA: MHYT domain-containing protein [Xanthobacteraceae bacterium]|nr:MHYT domain-containing protein [Xanthobacteraceae bacterium]
MPVTYETWLVLLSIVMAIQGAYVGLTLAVQIGTATGMRRRVLLAGAALSLAVGIWTMHFVGMLAARMPFQVDYLVFPTLLSFLVCVIVVGTAVYATSSGPLTMLRLTLSACLMGGGIFTMHYIGMSALSESAYMIHDRYLVAASMAIAIAASGLALWLAAGRGGRPPLILSAIAFGFAVSGMHYTAMGGLTLLPFPSAPASAPALSTDVLAIVVAIVAFCLSGIFLLFLVPDPDRAPSMLTDRSAARVTGEPVPDVAEAPASVVPQSTVHDDNGAQPEFGRGTYAPLGGMGGPPRRFARHLPIEREGGTQFLPVDDVIAVHANSHYTFIYNGTDKLFCPLAIGEVESRLDNSRFVRIHRSHIVNIERVIGYRRSGDNEMVEMDAAHDYAVPVSRSRVGWLKTRVAAVMGAESDTVQRRRHHLAPQ